MENMRGDNMVCYCIANRKFIVLYKLITKGGE